MFLLLPQILKTVDSSKSYWNSAPLVTHLSLWTAEKTDSKNSRLHFLLSILTIIFSSVPLTASNLGFHHLLPFPKQKGRNKLSFTKRLQMREISSMYLGRDWELWISETMNYGTHRHKGLCIVFLFVSQLHQTYTYVLLIQDEQETQKSFC